MKWYSNSYRRGLIDMHIEDWNPEFLSEFSPEDYYNNLVIGKIQSPMIYLQSHVGYCYWPTKSGHMHNALKDRENIVKQLIDKCRDAGMHVVGYYSLIFNNWAESKYPEWKIITSEDEIYDRYGLCCPNNDGYRAFVFEQIKELSEFFMLDGMFYDMTFWPKICYCSSCEKRWSEEVGSVMPSQIDWCDPIWNLFVKKREEWIGEFASAITSETKRLMPNISVEHNFAAAIASDWDAGSTELINESCDYTGGDLYGDLYNHSFTCKYYMNITKNPPFEYMTCRCNPVLYQHTITKTEEALTLEVMLTCAHHGASLIIDAIDPCGTLDSRVYKRLSNIFTKQIEYEPYFIGELIEDIGVFFSTTSKYNKEGQNFNNKTCAVNTIKTLIENHVPVGVLSNGCMQNIDKYKFLFAPNLCGISNENNNRIIAYVKNGGNLYLSGVGEEALLKELIGSTFNGFTKENRTYIAPNNNYEYLFDEFNAKYPLPLEYKLPILELDNSDGVIATITLPYTIPEEQKFASIHSNPPGISTNIPAIVIKKYGCGNVIWSAAPIENDSRVNYKRVLINLLNLFIRRTDLSLTTTASKKVELISFKTNDSILISLVDLECTEELIPHKSFNIKLQSNLSPVKITRLHYDENISFNYIDGYICFDTEQLIMFDMYKINLRSDTKCQ